MHRRAPALAIALTLALAFAASARAADTANGTWSIDRQGGATHLEMRWSDGRGSDGSSSTDARRFGIARALASSGRRVRFRIDHEAGSFALDGVVGNARGGGTFTFAADATFFKRLRSRGYEIDSIGEEMAAAHLDVTTRYVDGIEAQGLHSDVGQLIALRALGVSPQYVEALRTSGVRELTAAEALSLRALHVDGAYVRGLASVGFSDLDAERYASLKALGVDAAYVRYLRSHGRTNLTVEQLLALKAENI